MKTTPALISFLLHIEGFREKAYDDQQPHLDLNPGDEHLVKGRITYGSGLTRRPDGTPLRLGDTITWQENADRVTRYVRLEVEPVIENLIHVPLWDEAYDAIGSVIYNFGADEVSGWRLWGRINRGEPGRDIAVEWITGTYIDDGEPVLGLWQRRFMEILMFFKLDWKIGDNVGWRDDPVRLMESLGWEEDRETADLNMAQLEDLEDEAREIGAVVVREAAPEVATKATTITPKPKVAVKTAKSPIPVDHIEYLDDEAKAEVKVKKLKDSQRGQGFAKKKVAEVSGTIAVGGMIAEQVGAIEPVVKFASAYSMNAIGIVLGLTVVGSVVYWAYGEWQEKKGRDEADTLLG